MRLSFVQSAGYGKAHLCGLRVDKHTVIRDCLWYLGADNVCLYSDIRVTSLFLMTSHLPMNSRLPIMTNLLLANSHLLAKSFVSKTNFFTENSHLSVDTANRFSLLI